MGLQIKQECIPVGRVPTAPVAATRCHYWGGWADPLVCRPPPLGCRHPYRQTALPPLLCNAVACPHLERSGMGTACSRSASAHLYHAGSRVLPCDGAAD